MSHAKLSSHEAALREEPYNAGPVECPLLYAGEAVRTQTDASLGPQGAIRYTRTTTTEQRYHTHQDVHVTLQALYIEQLRPRLLFTGGDLSPAWRQRSTRLLLPRRRVVQATSGLCNASSTTPPAWCQSLACTPRHHSPSVLPGSSTARNGEVGHCPHPSPTPSSASNHLPATFTSLNSLLSLSNTALQVTPPSPKLITCPFNPNHLLPPDSLFHHHLCCPSFPCPIPLPLHSPAYPNILYSLPNRILSLLRAVLGLGFAKEHDLVPWIIASSPRYGVVINSPMQKETVFVMAHMRSWKKESTFFKKAKKLFIVDVLHTCAPFDGARIGVLVYRFVPKGLIAPSEV
ncbi:hypothetical protein Ahy_B06g084555 [Arachis hypogaea]|uniref:CHHC U11-48K-type domain-containing protein n=1 Tax=Arachis hypogaea TaxID=3818 RepID=A0A444YS86_ARAHY|nr:hypothetical protein Ahy_B06g084555 [Arachis hypogaea]